MNRELKKAVKQLGTLHNLSDEQVATLSAMLLLNHYGHAVPDFEEKGVYLAELAKDGAMLREELKRRKQLKKQAILKMMQDNILVR
jgi:hypothetical protein